VAAEPAPAVPPVPAGDAEGAPAIRGEPDVARWYHDHGRQLYAVCLRLLGDAREAEEATQDAFVEGWRSWARFRGESAVATWLHGIAARVALRRLRDGHRRALRLVADSAVVARAATTVATTRRDMPDERIDLEAAIRALPERARAVLVLHELHGYELATVAEWMGTTVGTAKSQLHRARQLLMRSLDR
jgi:RNA polymerase sigma-70 factor (ECF subfamily)